MNNEIGRSFDAQKESTELKIRRLLKPDVASQEGVKVYQEYEVGEQSVSASVYPEDIYDEVMDFSDYYPSVSVRAEIVAPMIQEINKDPNCVARRRSVKNGHNVSTPYAYKSVAVRFDTGEDDMITVETLFLPHNKPQLLVTRDVRTSPFSEEQIEDNSTDAEVVIERDMTAADLTFINAFLDQALLQTDVTRAKSESVNHSKEAFIKARKKVIETFDMLMRNVAEDGSENKVLHFLTDTSVLNKIIEGNRDAEELRLMDDKTLPSTAVKLVTTEDPTEPRQRYFGISIKSDDMDNNLMPIYLECWMLGDDVDFHVAYFDEEFGTTWLGSTSDMLGLLDLLNSASGSEDPALWQMFNGSHNSPHLN